MSAYKLFFPTKMLFLVFIAFVNIGGCGGFGSGDWDCGGSCLNSKMETEDICFSFEDIEISECPAVDVLELCGPYLCEGCTSEFCVDFNFPEAFIGCQAIDCHTIDCDGVYDIQVDGYPSWTTIIGDEEVQITCQ
jgi:hypothetical protein